MAFQRITRALKQTKKRRMSHRRSKFEIGVDIVSIDRIREILNSKYKKRFLARCFSRGERIEGSRLKRSAEYFAGRYALKEALIKLVSGRKGIRLSEISCTGRGKRPRLEFSGKTSMRFRGFEISFSISHDRDYAIAVAIGRRTR
jgi:holo-[acyl-carrier protein] synthase